MGSAEGTNATVVVAAREAARIAWEAARDDWRAAAAAAEQNRLSSKLFEGMLDSPFLVSEVKKEENDQAIDDVGPNASEQVFDASACMSMGEVIKKKSHKKKIVQASSENKAKQSSGGNQLSNKATAKRKPHRRSSNSNSSSNSNGSKPNAAAAHADGTLSSSRRRRAREGDECEGFARATRLRGDRALFLFTSQKVQARFQGGHMWYEGVVGKDNGDGTFEIKYADGDVELAVPAGFILPII